MLGMVALVTVQARAEEPDARAALEAAVKRYAAGEPAVAKEELLALLARGPDLPAELRHDAWAWLGDILFTEGGEGAAREAFGSLLSEAPDYVMDPFEHPPEVVAWFEDLRRERVVVMPPPPDPSTEPWPWTVLLPGGVHYWVEGKPVQGVAFGVLQVGCAAVSVFSYAQIEHLYERRVHGEEKRLQTLIVLNRTTGIVAYAAYLTPIALETAAWGTRRRMAVSVGPGTVTFTGSF